MSDYIAKFEIIWNGEQARYYTNVRPLTLITPEGRLEDIEDDLFGQFGTVGITEIYDSTRSQYPFVRDQRCFIFTVDTALMEDFREYPSPRMRFRDFIPLCTKVDSTVFRELVVLDDDYRPECFRSWGGAPLDGVMPPITSAVYLASGDRIFGPFSWDRSGDDGVRFFPASAVGDRYSVQCFDRGGIEIQSFEAGRRHKERASGKMRHMIRTTDMPAESETIDCIDDASLKDLMMLLLSSPAYSRGDRKLLQESIEALPSERITDDRRARMLEMIRNGELADQTMKLVPTVLAADAATLDPIIKTIIGNIDYAKKIWSVIKNSEGIEKAIGAGHDKETKTTGSAGGAEVAALRAEAAALRDRVAQLEASAAPESERASTLRDLEALKSEYGEMEAKYSSLVALRDSIEGEVRARIRSACTGAAFDGAVASVMMREAADFERRHRESAARRRARRPKGRDERETADMSPSELVSHIQGELASCGGRDISRNDAADLLISMSTGFLTIIAGPPGTGKTSLVSMLASSMGLCSGSDPRYLEIAVERGWTSRRDLIGSWDPLSRSFEPSGSGLYEGLLMLDEEAKAGAARAPYLVLLDGADMSTLEHCWSDFMRVSDLDATRRAISLGEAGELAIAPSLRFFAAISTDGMTEPLSARIIDRAWVIPSSAPDIGLDEAPVVGERIDCPTVSDRAMRMLAEAGRDGLFRPSPAVVSKFDRVRAMFRDAGLAISPRSVGMIRSYCAAARLVMDESDNSYTALDYAVSRKLLPMIGGSSDGLRQFADELGSECGDGSMPICRRMLDDIASRAEREMRSFGPYAV